MSKYTTFITLFIASLVAFIVFFTSYMKAIFSIVASNDLFGQHFNSDPFEFFRNIFTPVVIISFLVMTACVLTAKILGIVWVAKNKTITGGEKALWIVGFVIFGFVTSIVFLVLAKSKKLVD